MANAAGNGKATLMDDDRAEAVLDTVRSLVAELFPRAAARLTLDSELDRDLGLDSLALVELLSRLESAFGITLPDELLLEARTPRDLIAALGPAATAPASVSASASPVPAVAPAHPESLSQPEPMSRPSAPPPDRDDQWAPAEATTLPEVLAWHAARHPDQVHIRFLAGDDRIEELTYGTLFESANAAAAALQRLGVGPGDSVALMLPTTLDYFVAFFGVLLAGAVPVPIYPPARMAEIEDHLQRQGTILDNARARVLISVPEAARAAQLLKLRVQTLTRVVTVADLKGAGRPQQVAQAGSATALLQYTSGSTSMPKGVVLSHDNLLACIRAMGVASAARRHEVFVSWLPLYHDMGLIGAWMAPLYYGWKMVLMTPQSFLARPVRWLRAISTYGATISAAPNFAYELCLQRISDDKLAGIDLSTWRIALNGAEAVPAVTIRRFAERFGPVGFKLSAMYPVYGLAEASLGVTFPTPGEEPTIDRIAREPFAANGRAVPAGDGEASLELVGCGFPLPGFELRIVDDAGEAAGERQQGVIEFRGPAATSGYFRNPLASRELFHDGWLISGDLGYLAGGELFVTGRAKDMIIKAGRNIHPQGIEVAAGEVPGVRKGRTAVFGATDPAAGTEKLVVLAETKEREQPERQRIRKAIIAACIDVAGVPPDDIVLAAPGTILKTSSGKIRRADCRRRYEEGKLGPARRPVWRQVASLASTGAALRLRRLPGAAATGLFGAYAWGIVGVVAPPVWLLLGAVPAERRWGVFRAGAKTFLFLCAETPTVSGLEHLPEGACVLVANHASILDGMVLAAALPGPLVFPVVGDLASGPVTGPFLRRLGAAFVDRTDRKEAAALAGSLLERVKAGAVLAFFPEGTMSRVPGLHPFRMGAFMIGADAQVPVVPVAIKGTGDVLRGDRRFPRHHPIEVMVSPPISSDQTGWPGAVELRDAARAALLASTGEADLES